MLTDKLKKQDRQGIRTPAGLEQKYDFYRTQGAAAEATLAAMEAKKAASEATQAAANANQVAKEAKSAVDALAKPADYIIECGVSDNWTYEKWNSGKAVCWRTVVKAVNYKSALNDSTYFTKTNIVLPASLFVSAPSFVSIGSILEDSSYLLEERIAGISNLSVDLYAYVNSTSAVALNVQFVIEAKGSWF